MMTRIPHALLLAVCLPSLASGVTLMYTVTEADLNNIPVIVEHTESANTILLTLHFKKGSVITGSELDLTLRNQHGDALFRGFIRAGGGLDGDSVRRFDFEIHRDLIEKSSFTIPGTVPVPMRSPSSHLVYKFSLSSLFKRSKGRLGGVDPLGRAFRNQRCDTDAFLKEVERTFLKRMPHRPPAGNRLKVPPEE